MTINAINAETNVEKHQITISRSQLDTLSSSQLNTIACMLEEITRPWKTQSRIAEKKLKIVPTDSALSSMLYETNFYSLEKSDLLSIPDIQRLKKLSETATDMELLKGFLSDFEILSRKIDNHVIHWYDVLFDIILLRFTFFYFNKFKEEFRRVAIVTCLRGRISSLSTPKRT